MTSLLIRCCEVEGQTVDVRLSDGQITAIGPELYVSSGEEVIDAQGGALLPGLHDAHLHLLALAAAARSVICGPATVTNATALTRALAAAQADADGWVRGIGYVETVAGDLDAAALDGLHRHRPVRVQHRSGALWMVNSVGAVRLALDSADHPGVERGYDGTPTGRLWRADTWLRDRLPPADPPDLSAVGRRLGALGVTSVCDATPDAGDTTIEALAEARRSGVLPQRVQLLGVPLHHGPLPRGLTAGPYKIVIADSALPDVHDLTDRIRVANVAGRAVAVHCVTRESLVLLLAALESAGVRSADRVEHAALVPVELIPELARTRLRVVTQPGFLAERGDNYLRDVPAGDHTDLYRCRSLLHAGVPLALSSDAPYGPLDPWSVIGAAVHRRTAGGRVIGPDEVLTAEQALGAYLSAPDSPGGPPRRVLPGMPADLVLLDRPLLDQLAAPTSEAVRTVLVSGRIVHSS
jgi:predicted amidohydrolase YtcJ